MKQGSNGAWARRAVAATAALLLVVGAACTDDADTTSTSGGQTDDTVTAGAVADLLGPDDVASGDPVKIGFMSDGATDAFDNTDEIRAAKATAAYWNQHQGGIAGRPIEVISCESGADPSATTDCANRFISEDVVAVVQSQTANADAAWQVLHAGGIPTFFSQGAGGEMQEDSTDSFLVFNPAAALFGLPLALADAAGTDQLAFVVIDVPQAVDLVEAQTPQLNEAGYDIDLVRVPIGTADMSSQMQQVANTGAGVVYVVGNDAFCIAAFQGLNGVGYDGEVAAVNQCITDATREAMPTGLEGISVLSSLALGAIDDPTYQKYLAVMDAYGQDVTDVDNFTSMGGYAAMGALATALRGLTGEVTPATVVEAIKAMPQSEYPGGGGIMFQCGGTAAPSAPAVCTNQWLRAELDASGNATTYTVEDSSDVFG